MRRRFKAVMDVLDAMIRSGVSLSRSLELTAQWDKILAVLVLCTLLPLMTYLLIRVWVSVPFSMLPLVSIVVLVTSFMLWLFADGMRRSGSGAIGFVKTPRCIPYRWLRPDLVPPAPFLQCQPHLTPGGSGVLSDPARIDEEFRKAWLPYFGRSGQRDPSLEEFDFEVEEWLPLLPEVSLPRLTGQMLADVVQRKSATAGSLDGWGWRELKVLPVSWHDELARILTKVEDVRVWPDGLLDAYIAMIPKTDAGATLPGQRPLSVLPIVYRTWASAWLGQLDVWFRSWVPDSVISAGCGRGSVEVWFIFSLDIEEVLALAADFFMVGYGLSGLCICLLLSMGLKPLCLLLRV